MKKVAVEKKKATKGLVIAYVITIIAILVVVAYVAFWLSNDFPKTIQWGFTY